MGKRGVQLIVIMATALLLASGIALAEEVWKTVECDPDSTSTDPCLGDQGGISQDIIKGTKNVDYINALYEKDIVEAGGKGDFVYGSFGDDHLYGDYVHETVVDENGKPVFEETKVDENDNPVSDIDGDAEDYMDKLYGEHGDDHLYGGPGPDTLDGSLDDDTLKGQQGNDKLYGSIGTDDLSGGDGCDILYGSLGSDTIDAEDVADSDCVDDEGIYDTVYGEDGDDTIYAEDNKKDKIYCGFGEDTVWADNVDEFPVPENCEHVLPEITTIDVKPANPTNDKTPSFSFSSSEPSSTFQCKLDGGNYETCTSPTDYTTELADGSHTFSVKATDAAGNTDETPASYSWTVDTKAPETTIGSTKPANPTNNTSASFSFTSTETGSTFECSKDNQTWATCTSPYNYSNTALQEGSHDFYVRAKDAAGNDDETPASYRWTVDTTPPTVTSVEPTGVTGVARDRSAIATFAEKMKSTTLNTSTFKLFKCSSITSTTCTTQITSAPVTVSFDGLSATLNPYGTTSTLLARNTKYKVVVTTGAKDLAGNAMTQNKVWYFTTVS